MNRSIAARRRVCLGLFITSFFVVVRGVVAKSFFRNVTRDGGLGERILFLGPNPHEIEVVRREYLQGLAISWNSERENGQDG